MGCRLYSHSGAPGGLPSGKGYRPWRVVAGLLALALILGFCGFSLARELAPAEKPPPTSGSEVALNPEERLWLTRHDGRIRVGITVIPPQVLPDNGAYKGLSVDYLRLLEGKLGVRFQLVPFATWNEVIQAARQRRIDMIFAAQRTPERLNYLLFTEPYLELPNMIVVRKERKGGSNLKEMAGWSVAVSKGSAVQEYLQREFPALDLHQVPDELTGLRQVSLGEVDAMVVEISRASYYIEKAGILNLHVSGEAGLVYRLRFAVRSDWPVLAHILDHGLAAIAPAERRAIYRRWILVPGQTSLTGRNIRIALLMLLGVVVLAVGCALTWNRTLRRKVRQRTAQLQQEMAERQRAEEGRRETELQLHALVDNLPHCLARFDTDCRHLFVNPAVTRTFGVPPEVFLGKTLREVGKLGDEEQSQLLEGLIKQAFATGEANTTEVQWQTVTGECWFEVMHVPERDPAGRVISVLGLAHDITRRKQTEDALLNSVAEVQDLYNQAPCGYHSLDRDGMFIRVNDTELRWLGYQRDEVIGKLCFSDLLTEAGRELFRESFPRFKEQGWISDLEFDLRRRDGSLLPVLLSATAVCADGEFLMSRSTIFDMTERRKSAAQEHLLSAIVHSTDDAIFAKDLDGTILSWNSGAERIYGYRAEEAIGRPVTMLVPREGQEELTTILRQLRQGERVEHFTTRRQRKDGRLISVALTISPIREPSGQVVGASTIARDVSEQMRAESEIASLNTELEGRVNERTLDLRESQRALMNIVEDLNEKTSELEAANAKLRELDHLKSMFIASMSHELRTPLNSIIGFSSILHDAWVGPVNDEQKENLATILRCGKHLLALINDVIDVSKIEAGKIEPLPEDFDLRELAEEAVGLIGPALQEKGLELRIEVPAQPMHTDRRRLLQCLLNLLSNAVKFTEQGSVAVTAQILPAAGPTGKVPLVELSVTDTGVGIQPEDLPKMFQPFVRLESPLQVTVPGTGLGLYLSRRLAVQILRGDILLTSEFGRGSCFTLRLPARLP